MTQAANMQVGERQTGRTWRLMLRALSEAHSGREVIFVCASQHFALLLGERADRIMRVMWPSWPSHHPPESTIRVYDRMITPHGLDTALHFVAASRVPGRTVIDTPAEQVVVVDHDISEVERLPWLTWAQERGAEIIQ